MKSSDFLPALLSGRDGILVRELTAQFHNLAMYIENEVPPSADRTAALRKMLEAKMTLVQGITHQEEPGDYYVARS